MLVFKCSPNASLLHVLSSQQLYTHGIIATCPVFTSTVHERYHCYISCLHSNCTRKEPLLHVLSSQQLYTHGIIATCPVFTAWTSRITCLLYNYRAGDTVCTASEEVCREGEEVGMAGDGGCRTGDGVCRALRLCLQGGRLHLPVRRVSAGQAS